MCEHCDQTKEQLWAEVRDLLNYNRKNVGPLSADMKERVAQVTAESKDEIPDEFLDNYVEAIRANMIMERCVLIARFCEGTEFHQMPASQIAGIWAGELMKMEMRAAMADGGSLLSMIFGMMMRPGMEDESDE